MYTATGDFIEHFNLNSNQGRKLRRRGRYIKKVQKVGQGKQVDKVEEVKNVEKVKQIGQVKQIDKVGLVRQANISSKSCKDNEVLIGDKCHPKQNYTYIDNAWIDHGRDRTNNSQQDCEKRCTSDIKCKAFSSAAKYGKYTDCYLYDNIQKNGYGYRRNDNDSRISKNGGFMVGIKSPQYIKNSLSNGEELKDGQSLVSKNGKYRLTMRTDGNLVLYNNNGKAKWASGKYYGKNRSPYKLIMQTDGNLVVYDKNMKVIWASNVYKGNSHSYKLVLKDNGKLVVYKNGEPMWPKYNRRSPNISIPWDRDPNGKILTYKKLTDKIEGRTIISWADLKNARFRWPNDQDANYIYDVYTNPKVKSEWGSNYGKLFFV